VGPSAVSAALRPWPTAEQSAFLDGLWPGRGQAGAKERERGRLGAASLPKLGDRPTGHVTLLCVAPSALRRAGELALGGSRAAQPGLGSARSAVTAGRRLLSALFLCPSHPK